MSFNNAHQIIGWMAALFAVSSIIFGLWEFGEPFAAGKGVKVGQAVVLGCWILLPPVWLLIEYFYIWPKMVPQPRIEEFKYGQELASKLWLALVTLLLGLYFGKDLAPDGKT